MNCQSNDCQKDQEIFVLKALQNIVQQVWKPSTMILNQCQKLLNIAKLSSFFSQKLHHLFVSLRAPSSLCKENSHMRLSIINVKKYNFLKDELISSNFNFFFGKTSRNFRIVLCVVVQKANLQPAAVNRVTAEETCRASF